jgi:small subunit ribosomal protein S17e
LGKVKTEQVKRTAKELIERFPDKFSGSFDENKQAVNELTRGTTTRVRNQIAGYITHSYVPEETEETGESSDEEETEA